MQIWSRYPMVRLLLPFIAGIMIALYLHIPLHIPLFVFAVAISILILMVSFHRKWITYRTRWIYGLLINLLLMGTGYELAVQNTPIFQEDHFSHLDHQNSVLLGRITEQPVDKPNSVKVVVDIEQVIDSARNHQSSGCAILYLQNDSAANQLSYGDRILIKGGLDAVEPPTNPHQFDYRKYLANQGVYHSTYKPSHEWKFFEKGRGNPLYRTAYDLRSRFLNIFKAHDIAGDEYAVVSALILGYRDTLDDDLRQKFAGAGAMHVLCVSGLHVGIIYLIISGMLGFMKRKKWIRVLRVVLILLIIWCYAMITGFSPSVLRASTMFSFVTIGTSMKRHTNIYNTLAASAFLLLLINPYMITQVGFQLSYVAVLGIVAMQPYLYKLWVPDWWLLDKAWAIITVSIAAQLATFPIAVHYFHQFPAFFLLTNLIVIPLAGFIIYAGLLVLVLSFIPLVSSFFAAILAYLVRFMNESVSFIEGLPASTFDGLVISWTEAFIIYGLFLTMGLFLLTPRAKKLQLSLCLLILFAGFGVFRDYHTARQQKFIVYDIPGHSGYDLIHKDKAIAFVDSAVKANRQLAGFYVDDHRLMNGIKTITYRNTNEHPSIACCQYFDVIGLGQKRITLLRNLPRNMATNRVFETDYLVINQDNILAMKELLKLFKFDFLIFDSSVKWWDLEDWIEECRNLNIAFHAVSRDGAYIVDLSPKLPDY
ncbi:MAG: competence protein ComEC family protein [Bacteroidales bacterium]|nr:competence protein ComEC family protein [Bacteroidales bacterium]